MNKQLEVAKYLNTVDTATLDEIYENVSFSYYCNENKHLGNLLSTMVKAGTVERIKKGVFKLVKSYVKAGNKVEAINKNQSSLF